MNSVRRSPAAAAAAARLLRPQVFQRSLPTNNAAAVVVADRRSMASHKNRYIRDASNKTGITPEIRDLVRNQKSFENLEEWKLGPGIGEPERLRVCDQRDIDNDQMRDIVYYPHKDEVVPKLDPSPALLVQKVYSLKGEPYWHKRTCEELGIGQYTRLSKMVVLPNTPYYAKKLFDVKHLVKVTPITFPNSIPREEDLKSCRLLADGRVICHPKLEVSDEMLDEPKHKMKVTVKQIEKKARKEWEHPWQTPLGNSNYNRDTTTHNPEMNDFITDDTRRVKY